MSFVSANPNASQSHDLPWNKSCQCSLSLYLSLCLCVSECLSLAGFAYLFRHFGSLVDKCKNTLNISAPNGIFNYIIMCTKSTWFMCSALVARIDEILCPFHCTLCIIFRCFSLIFFCRRVFVCLFGVWFVAAVAMSHAHTHSESFLSAACVRINIRDQHTHRTCYIHVHAVHTQHWHILKIRQFYISTFSRASVRTQSK